jgi:hypothetical protein
MTAERPDGRELPSLGPARHRFGVYPEKRGDFGRREERIIVLRLHAASNVLDSKPGFPVPMPASISSPADVTFPGLLGNHVM